MLGDCLLTLIRCALVDWLADRNYDPPLMHICAYAGTWAVNYFTSMPALHTC